MSFNYYYLFFQVTKVQSLILSELRAMKFFMQLSKYLRIIFGSKERTKNNIFNKSQLYHFSVQFSSVTQSCPTLCNPMNHSRPGLPVHHKLPEFTQTDVHRVSDAIQPSHPLSSPSSPTLNLSQNQDLSK